MPGKLLLIGTPIGNLQDLSPRAIEAIRSCSVLLCEDTRHTRKLLNHFGIDVRTESFHEHNEQAKTDGMLDRVAFGETIGIVSDAGLPILSDPGFPIVRRARERRIVVEPVPGPFAGALALIASGIAPVPFAFFGFAPHRHGERVAFYQRVADTAITAVVYESPHRLLDSLRDAASVMGEVEVTVARELTKIHEEFLNGPLSEVLDTLAGRDAVRGEFTFVFAAREEPRTEVSIDEVARELDRLMQTGLSRSDSLKLLAERYGKRKNELYRMLVDREEKS